MIEVEKTLKLKLSNRSKLKQSATTDHDTPATESKPRGKIPRVARLMALSIQFDEMLRTGEVNDATELAAMHNVTQPRMSQIRALALLAPDIQEAILNLPAEHTGRSRITEKHLRPICAEVNFDRQRQMWQALQSSDSAT